MDNQEIFLESFDINLWYRNHEICPTCDINLREMNPATNLYPHWIGACKPEGKAIR